MRRKEPFSDLDNMAIRRPSINAPTWVFQDFLYSEESDRQSRCLQVKWDGQQFERISQTFDYSNPPFVGDQQKAGPIVAQIDYTVQGKVITINDWQINWKDEWPLRLAVNYIVQCLYPTQNQFVLRVAGNEAYNQAGEPVYLANNSPYPFWISEQFLPVTNDPDEYLFR